LQKGPIDRKLDDPERSQSQGCGRSGKGIEKRVFEAFRDL
jgi:hypothetical protein